MKIFELSLDGWDTYSPILFYNPNKTNEEFENDVKICLNFVVDNLEEEVTVMDLHTLVSEELFKMEYEELEKFRISFNDNYEFEESEDFIERGCKTINEMLGKEKIEKIIESNKEFSEKSILNSIEDCFHHSFERLLLFQETCKDFDHKLVFNNLPVSLKVKCHKYIHESVEDFRFYFLDEVEKFITTNNEIINKNKILKIIKE